MSDNSLNDVAPETGVVYGGTGLFQWYSEYWHVGGSTVPAHCTTGPLFDRDRIGIKLRWVHEGMGYTFSEWCTLAKPSAEQIVLLKLQYDITPNAYHIRYDSPQGLMINIKMLKNRK